MRLFFRLNRPVRLLQLFVNVTVNVIDHFLRLINLRLKTDKLFCSF